jgi:predicted metal-binding protein
LNKIIKIGIIICDRYRSCAGGKCLRALRNREGGFSIYKDTDIIELVGYTSCGGCPGGNIEYAPEEMKKNGVEVIHLATGMIVGYPPCIYLDYFAEYIQKRFGIKVIMGTHPIPQNYYNTHKELNTWEDSKWNEILHLVMTDEKTRLLYD